MPDYVTDMTRAAAIIRSARRIVIAGCSGGGKTTLARRLAEKFDLPHISMDKAFFWLPGWRARPREEQREMIAAAVATERWVMDGSNPSSFDLRLPRSDVFIWVRMPRLLCLYGVTKRYLRDSGRTREDMAEGCPEQIPHGDFLTYIWNFEKVHAPLFIRNIELFGAGKPVVVLKSRRQMRELLDLAGCGD